MGSARNNLFPRFDLRVFGATAKTHTLKQVGPANTGISICVLYIVFLALGAMSQIVRSNRESDATIAG